MKKIKLIAFELPSRKFTIVDVDTGKAVMTNITHKEMDTNLVMRTLAGMTEYAGRPYSVTYVYLDNWNHIKVGDRDRPLYVD